MATRKINKKSEDVVYFYTVGTEWLEDDKVFIDSTIVKKSPNTELANRVLEVEVNAGRIVIITNEEDIRTLSKNDETPIYLNEKGESMTETLRAEKELAEAKRKNAALEKKLAELSKAK